MENKQMSSGLPGLDGILGGVLAGDNIVLQVDSIDDYRPFVKPFCERAVREGRRLIYFRFARHGPLVSEDMGAEVYELDPSDGFELFLAEIHKVIEQAGKGACYVFDCLTDLVVDWYSDQMLANFFMLTCPYLYDFETAAFFAIIGHSHSSYATAPIVETAQVFLNIYRHKGKLYVYPIKVEFRHSPTMYMLHEWHDDEFTPISESVIISEVLSSRPRTTLESGEKGLGMWSRTFLKGEALLEDSQKGDFLQDELDKCYDRLERMAVTRDERMLGLARKFFDMDDLLAVGSRMIGTGLIGGKSVGLLLAQAILAKADSRWNEKLEKHDSFYIGSDVFYSFLVQNGCWWLRQSLSDPTTFLTGAREARRIILRGNFPDYRVKHFSDMLDYFGQSPIIVRSSSLLEDNFGNAFAGKYESLFCANQGTRDKRLQDFMSAVRKIYASAMSEDALKYRARRGLLERDEQMALLVQRVSGSLYDNLFYPQIAGVGLSFNPYVWNEKIDPGAGLLRLVFGMGTRAVDRSDDDYTRLVALNAPEQFPGDTTDKSAQKKVDVLDLSANQLVSQDFCDVARHSINLPIEKFASRDRKIEQFALDRGLKDIFPWTLTFDELLKETDFVKDMREMLQILQDAYNYPVDIEFAANFLPDGSYKINLLQCRPLQVGSGVDQAEPPAGISNEDIVMQTSESIIGQSRLGSVERLIYVVPEVYAQLSNREKYSIARSVGNIVHADTSGGLTVMLLGPGRWGTTTPSLGVPVSFAEINRVSVLCEIIAGHDGLVPDVSLGTHFFNDIVESDMLYLGMYMKHEGSFLNEDFLLKTPNKLREIVPSIPETQLDAIKVIDIDDLPGGVQLKLNANTLKQRAVCYLET
jgi:pyruvate, water dikinase